MKDAKCDIVITDYYVDATVWQHRWIDPRKEAMFGNSRCPDKPTKSFDLPAQSRDRFSMLPPKSLSTFAIISIAKGLYDVPNVFERRFVQGGVFFRHFRKVYDPSIRWTPSHILTV